MIVQEFIDELSRRLRDVKKKQWDDEFLISATNSALGALSVSLPQVFAVNRDLVLVPGSEQVIDDDLHRIVSILHNLSSVDGTVRRSITKADMSAFDATYPHWRQDEPRSYIRHWMVDEFDESKFYVWPPAPSDTPMSVRGTFTQTPFISSTAEPMVTSELPVKRVHIPALQEFAMYYAYSVDDDLTANSGRAQRHWLAFFQLINKREDSDLVIGQARETTE